MAVLAARHWKQGIYRNSPRGVTLNAQPPQSALDLTGRRRLTIKAAGPEDQGARRRFEASGLDCRRLSAAPGEASQRPRRRRDAGGRAGIGLGYCAPMIESHSAWARGCV